MTKIIRKIYFIIVDFYSSNMLRLENGFTAGNGLKIKGKPVVEISKGASIILGQNVTLNSRNYSYHASMHSPVKLMADRKEAVIEIGRNTRVNGACLHAYNRIQIGENCLIAANVQIIDANGHELSFDNVVNRINTSSCGKPIVIEDNVWIGLNAVILPGVKVGRGSVIGANTVVSTDVPPMVIFSGNPGRVVKQADE